MSEFLSTQVRAEQSDPIVMYLIVRESLIMGVGKIAAQCAHASQMLLLEHIANDHIVSTWDTDGINFTLEQYNIIKDGDIFAQWLSSSFRKVVLRADDKEWIKIKESFTNCVVVVDAGLTEIAPGSETVIGLWPMKKSEVPKLISKLQALK